MPVAQPRFSERGSTLLEVLIAVLVLSVGLLGALKLQTLGMRQNSDSRYVLTAASLGQDAMDQIGYVRSSSTDWTLLKTAKATDADTTPVLKWLYHVQTSLPAGKAAISCTGGECTVTLYWTPPGAEEMKAIYVVRT
jgi:type IV pilus assembly protein PilV